MLLFQHERDATVLDAFQITFQQRITDVFLPERQVPRLGGQVRANSKPNQVVWIGKRVGFVEIIDSPDETALDVAPSAEILHVQVTDCQHPRSFRLIGTHFRPELCPAIKCGAEKWEDRQLHVGMLEVEILLDDLGAFRQPFLELPRRLDYVHKCAP